MQMMLLCQEDQYSRLDPLKIKIRLLFQKIWSEPGWCNNSKEVGRAESDWRLESQRSTVDNMSVVICLPYHYLNKFYISVRKANNISVSIIVQKVH